MSRSAILGSSLQVEDGSSIAGSARRNKIDLADYDYKSDIENRLMLSSFSPFEVEALDEILLSSLTLSASSLAATLDVQLSDLDALLAKLESALLLQRDGDRLVVDKERRKYFEFEFAKFDESFEPNMEFLQGLLRKVPIHQLPLWYSIPRSSTNIFESLLERFLETPRAFQRYLLEMQLEDETDRQIVERLFASPELKLDAEELQSDLGLSREELEEHILTLEFLFIAVLSYERTDSGRKSVITPFHEWRQFLLFRQETMPLPMTGAVSPLREEPFAVVRDMALIVEDLAKSPIRAERQSGSYLFEIDDPLMQRLAQLCDLSPLEGRYERYFAHLLGKLALIEFLHEREGSLSASTAGQEWLMLDVEERAIALYRHPFNTVISREIDPRLNGEHNLREIERTLERVAHLGWVEIEDFLRGVIAPVGSAPEVRLERRGRRWRYQLPTYTQEERELIRASIFERFFEGGFVEVGELEGALHFRVTPFGRAVIAGGSSH